MFEPIAIIAPAHGCRASVGWAFKAENEGEVRALATFVASREPPFENAHPDKGTVFPSLKTGGSQGEKSGISAT